MEAVPQFAPLRNHYGYLLLWSGRYLEAIRQFETYVELRPGEGNAYNSLAEAYLFSGQPERALEAFARELEEDPSFGGGHKGRAWAYAMQGRYDRALAEVTQYKDLVSQEKPYWRSDVLPHFIEAFLLSRLGRYREAEATLREGIERARQLEQIETEAGSLLLAALLAVERENYPKALAYVSQSQKLLDRISDELGPFNLPNQRTGLTGLAHLLAGIAEARLGNLESARRNLNEQTDLYAGAANIIENWHHHALQGEIALAEGDLAAAQSAFSAGQPELKMWFNQYFPGPSVFANNSPSRDGLARVQEAQGDLAGAIRSYRELNTPGMSSKWTAWVEPRYLLEVAGLLDETGDKEAARAEYERFLELWKDADKGLPELTEARAYLAQ